MQNTTAAAIWQFVYLQDDKTYLYSGSMGPGQFSALTDDILRLFSGSTNGPVPTCGGTIPRTKATNGTTSSATGLHAYRYKTAVQPTIFIQPQIFSLMHRWPPPSATANGYIWTLRARSD